MAIVDTKEKKEVEISNSQKSLATERRQKMSKARVIDDSDDSF